MKKLKIILFNWYVSKLPTCETITRQLSDSSERKLNLSERVTLKLHLKCCIWCTRYGQQIDFLDKAMQLRFKEAEKQIIDASLSAESKKRMKHLIENYQN